MRYQIVGETLPVVICELEGGEKMINEGAVSYTHLDVYKRQM